MAWLWPVAVSPAGPTPIGFEHIRDVQAQQRHSADRYSFPHSRDGSADVRYERAGDWRLSPQRQPGDRLAGVDLGAALRSNKDMIDRDSGMIRTEKGEVVGTHRITITARPPASLPHCLRSTRWRPLPAPGCWRNVQSLHRLRPASQTGRKGYNRLSCRQSVPLPLDDAETTAAWMNKIVEQCISDTRNSIWLHRRFKNPAPAHALPLLIPLFPAAPPILCREACRSGFRLSFSFKSSPPLRIYFSGAHE